MDTIHIDRITNKQRFPLIMDWEEQQLEYMIALKFAE